MGREARGWVAIGLTYMCVDAARFGPARVAIFRMYMCMHIHMAQCDFMPTTCMLVLAGLVKGCAGIDRAGRRVVGQR